MGPSTAAVQGDMLSDGRNGINMPLMEQNSVFAVFPAAEWALVAGDCGGAPLHSSPRHGPADTRLLLLQARRAWLAEEIFSMICSNIYTDKKWRGRGWRGGIMQITEAARVSLCLWLCGRMSPAPHCSRHTGNTTVRGEAAQCHAMGRP